MTRRAVPATASMGRPIARLLRAPPGAPEQLQIMYDKGLVARDEAQRSHLYEAAVEREPTERALIDDLATRAFGGSAATLALRALSARGASSEELSEIRRLLDGLEEE